MFSPIAIVVIMLILGIVLATIYVMVTNLKYSQGFDLLMGFNIVLILFILPVIVFVSFYSIHMLNVSTESEETIVTYEDKKSVVSLSDSITTETFSKGTFILGTGSIDEESKQIAAYNALVGSEKDGFKMRSYDMKETTLHFDENEQPFVQKKIEKKSLKKKKDWLNGGLMQYVDEVTTGVTEDIELHLPKNTVQVEYEVDLN